MSAPSIISVGNSAPVLLATIAAASLPYTSGPLMLEARRMKNWNFSLGGTFTNFSVEIDGTTDANTSGYIGYANTPPNSNWFKLYAPSEQSGEGSSSNPLTLVNQSLQYAGTLFAVRVVMTAVGTATGTCNVFGFAVT